jgi:glycosyltransferase involved in cell wall biosynthesis
MTVAGELLRSEGSAQAEVSNPPSRLFLMINSFETGGSERQFVSLAKSLDPRHFSLDLGCIQPIGPLRELFSDVDTFPLGGNLYGWRSWQSRRKLARHLRQKRIQIAHSFDFYTNLTLLPAARWAKIPAVIGSQRQLGDLLSPAQSQAQLFAFRYCDAVVCNSRAAADRLVQAGLPAEKIRVIGNVLLPEAFATTVPALPRQPGLLRVGMIARMNAGYKNHRGFLQAAARLLDWLPDTEFVLVGDGPLRPELETEAESLGITHRVRFLGDRRDVAAVLASLDVAVVPSDSEGLSNVILESFAAGVPVVATRVGGNPELVSEERGILVPAKDDSALANAMHRMLKDPSYRTDAGSNARRFAVGQFSAARIAGKYQELYAEVLAGKLSAARSIPGSGNASRRKLRVAIIAPSLRYVGGQSVQADLMLRNWAGDLEVQARFISVDPPFPIGLRWVRSVPGFRTLVRAPFYCARLWSGLKDADIAHIFSASYSSFLVAPLPAWIVARLRGKKTLINYRSGEARDHLQRSAIARAVLKRADSLVAPSGYLVDVFREFGLPAETVPNIIDLSQFCYRKRDPLRPHLVCTRGFHSYYCVDVVVKAFAKVQEAFPGAVLDLVGGGPLESAIRQLVFEMKLSGVNFCGVASRDQIGEYYDRADIFINASHLDNMPVSVLEAFACGTPVISTAPEGMRYLVEHGHTGLLSQPGDVDALAENVIRVLREPELAFRLSTNAFEQSRRYRWDSVREQWLRVYYSLVPSKAGAVQDSVVTARV